MDFPPASWESVARVAAYFDPVAGCRAGKRQFLIEYAERVIYGRYRVAVIGSVPIKMQFGNSQEIETRKNAFYLRGEICKTTLHKMKPRKRFAEDGRMNAFGSSGRKGPAISAPMPVHALSSL